MTTLKQFVRNKDGTKVGIFVALRQEDKILIGWSKCHMRLDKFNKKVGITIATNRAYLAEKRDFVLPHSMRDNFLNFEDRAIRYFKDCKLVESVVVPFKEMLK